MWMRFRWHGPAASDGAYERVQDFFYERGWHCAFVRETVAEVERLTRRETVAGMIAIWLTPRFEVSWPSERLEISQAAWRILAARHRQVKSGPNFWTRRQAG